MNELIPRIPCAHTYFCNEMFPDIKVHTEFYQRTSTFHKEIFLWNKNSENISLLWYIIIVPQRLDLVGMSRPSSRQHHLYVPFLADVLHLRCEWNSTAFLGKGFLCFTLLVITFFPPLCLSQSFFLHLKAQSVLISLFTRSVSTFSFQHYLRLLPFSLYIFAAV